MASYNKYEEAIAKAKAALESYSSETEALAKLYETAKANAQAAHEVQKQQTAVQAAEARRQADIDMQRTERNLNQRLASRGLALSGENAQTRLDLLVALRNQLAGIDSDERNQLASLEQSFADRQQELDASYASARADRAKQIASLNADLASAEAGKTAAEEANRIAAEEAAARLKAEEAAAREKEEKAAAAQAAKEAEKAAAAAAKENEKKKQAVVEKVSAGALSDPKKLGETFQQLAGDLMSRLLGGKSSGSAVTPEVSARNLAKQLVTAAGSSGKISGSIQQSRLAQLLDALTAAYKLDSAYYDELMLNLQSLGYRPDYASSVGNSTDQLQIDARTFYDASYARNYNLYRSSGYSESRAASLAKSDARYEQMRYLYTHSLDEEQFDYLIDAMQLSGYLDSFYYRLKKEDKNAKLSSELQ